ncbi:glycosyltransferase [Maribellus luteus]|uniref:Glycosyltransferase n=1 Tax=Maribellus luteus TaxID=2305463 RepID=A0A399SY84_9BACT|nr:glycosyltransferase [Maribellus luteus]RIJ47612.1 glycosyltransferase [Maribellus luteus]
MKKLISIIIVTYNSQKLIFDCLSSIIAQNDIGNSLEIIVVDNSSDDVDNIFDRIKDQFGENIILVKNKINGGYGQGNNVGIKIASAPIIMIMNPDVRLFIPIFQKAIAHFSKENVVMLGMSQWASPYKKVRAFGFDSVKINYYTELLISKIAFKLDLYNQKLMHISGACFFLRKESFENIGGFDENIFMYGEEVDIKFGLLSKNCKNKIRYDNKMKYIHLMGNREYNFTKDKKIIHSRIYVCNKFNITSIKYIKNKILSIKFRLSKIKENNDLKKEYRNTLQYLNEKKHECS